MVHRADTGETWSVPAVAGVKVVDPTGCGNAFCGGFLAAWRAGEKLLEAGLWVRVLRCFATSRIGLTPRDAVGLTPRDAARCCRRCRAASQPASWRVHVHTQAAARRECFADSSSHFRPHSWSARPCRCSRRTRCASSPWHALPRYDCALSAWRELQTCVRCSSRFLIWRALLAPIFFLHYGVPVAQPRRRGVAVGHPAAARRRRLAPRRARPDGR